MEKILSIGVPSYNAENTLRECIDSFINTGMIEDIQIIIVNDGSKDSTSMIGHEYQDRFPNSIIVVDKENGGHGSGINASIKYAKGKYLKIVDSDDAVEKDGFVSLVNELKNTDADLVLSPYYIVRNGVREFASYKRDDSKLKRTVCNINNADGLKFAMHSMTYRTELLKNSIYRIDEHCFYVDVEYSLYYLADVENILLLCLPVYLYTVGTENQSVNIKNMLNNIEQHTHVCESLIKFYSDISDKLTNDTIIKLIRENIINMALNTEYRIIFSLADIKKSKMYLLHIEEYAKKISPIIYNEIVNLGKKRGLKVISLLTILRRINYNLYPLIRKVFWNKLKSF